MLRKRGIFIYEKRDNFQSLFIPNLEFQINLNFYVESCNDYSININEQRVIRGMRIGMLTRLKKTDYLFQTSKQINLNFL